MPDLAQITEARRAAFHRSQAKQAKRSEIIERDADVRRLRRLGWSKAELSEHFGIGPSTVEKLGKGGQ